VIKRVPKPKGGPSLDLLYHRFEAVAFAAGGKVCKPRILGIGAESELFAIVWQKGRIPIEKECFA
jgi:hypothetical protein